MNIIKLLIVLGIVGGGYQYWKEHRQGAAHETIAAAAASESGFIAMPPVDGASAKTVLVIAAQNCPHEDAQRADGLADDLSRMGIPVTRMHSISFNITGPDNSALQQINSVMNGPLPIVIVNGRAKSSPTLAEVVAEYKGARQ